MMHSKPTYPTAAPLCFALLLLALFAGCARPHPVVEPAPLYRREGVQIRIDRDSPLRAKLEFETLEESEWHAPQHFTGRIAPLEGKLTRVFAPFPGKVVARHASLAGRVEAGEPLFTLHSPDYASARGEWLKARSALDVAERTLSRKRDLFAHRAAAERDVEEAQDALSVARADYDSARDLLSLAGEYGRNTDDAPPPHQLTVRSPLSGTVISLSISEGEVLLDNTEEVAVVADLSTVCLIVDVPERDLDHVQALHTAPETATIEARVSAYPSRVFYGRLIAVGSLLSEETRTLELRVEVPNSEALLRPGMFAEVALRGGSALRGLSVPETALVQVGGRSLVYEETAPGVLEARAVTLGPVLASRSAQPLEERRIAITAGLKAGAKILTKHGVLLP